MPAVVMIMVDALRHDYVGPETTPFLHSLGTEGRIRSLIPPFGFEPDYTIFAGLEPAEFPSGAQFKLAPATSPFWFVPRWVGSLLDRVPAPLHLGFRLAARWMAGVLNGSRRIGAHATTARIPFQLLRLFDFTQQYYPFEREFAPPGRSLFDVARDGNIPFLFHGFPRDEVSSWQVLAALKRRLRPRHGFVYLHIGDLDAVGHRYGPDSAEMVQALAQVDDVVRQIVGHARSVIGESQFVIFGDHGMCSVESLIDVGPILQRLKLKLRRDYLYFLDSTLIRFWCAHEAAREKISAVFDRVIGLKRVELRSEPPSLVGNGDSGLGDLVYQAKGGWIVHPSFYADGTPPKGMHGYGPEVVGNRAAGVVWPMRPFESATVKAQWSAEAVAMRGVYDVAREALTLMRP